MGGPTSSRAIHSPNLGVSCFPSFASIHPPARSSVSSPVRPSVRSGTPANQALRQSARSPVCPPVRPSVADKAQRSNHWAKNANLWTVTPQKEHTESEFRIEHLAPCRFNSGTNLYSIGIRQPLAQLQCRYNVEIPSVSLRLPNDRLKWDFRTDSRRHGITQYENQGNRISQYILSISQHIRFIRVWNPTHLA
jgi:hypothetical protein